MTRDERWEAPLVPLPEYTNVNIAPDPIGGNAHAAFREAASNESPVADEWQKYIDPERAMETSDLISRLTERAQPVEPIESPERKVLRFCVVVTLGLAMTDLLGRHGNTVAFTSGPAVVASLLAAAFTSLLAAYAAFVTSAPGRSSRAVLLTLPVSAAWSVVLVPEAVRQWAASGFSGLLLEPSIDCVLSAIVLSVPLLVLFGFQISRSASARPAIAGAFGGIAVAAAVWIGLRILVPHPDSMAMDMLVEQTGTMLIVAMIGAVASPGIIGRIAPERDTI